MTRRTASFSLCPITTVVLWLYVVSGQKLIMSPTGGCENVAPVALAVGSEGKPEKAHKVIDSNLTSTWTAWGEGKSMWLELAAPTVVEAVSIAFRKGDDRRHSFDIFLIDTHNQPNLVYVGRSGGLTHDMETFWLGDRAREAMAVTIVGYGSDKDKWNGFSEIQVCAHVPGHDSSMEESSSTPTSERLSPGFEGIVRELPFPEGQRGFNVVNMCSFPIRVGSTGNQATCSDGTAENPDTGKCFWALPEGNRDLEPGDAEQYVLPQLGLKEGSVIWAGNIWASTGCRSEVSDKYDAPASEGCVTNFCRGGTCPDYFGPMGITTKAEFALQESGLDFYDVSVIDGANLPMMISPTEAVPTANEHYCGSPGSTVEHGGLEACSWKFSPKAVDSYPDTDLSPYSMVVWPADSDNPVACVDGGQCDEFRREVCGIYEERSNGGLRKTGSLKPGVCGTPVGWLGAHTACGAVPDQLTSFPNEFPYDCHRAARHGTYEQLYRCSGDTYGKQACYLSEAEDSCCGCPEWDGDNGGCVNTNPDWTHKAAPWARFFKRACPTAYSFPRDDRTSVFVCSNEDLATQATSGRNTQSYTITFCAGNSEANMFSV